MGIRVLHIIDSLAASGGAERGLVREITRFRPPIEQKALLLYDRTDLVPTLERAGIDHEVVGLPVGRGSRTWPSAIVPARRVSRAFRPDVIQTSLFLGNLVGQVVGRTSGVPVVSNLVLSADRRLLRAHQPGASSLRAEVLRKLSGYAARSRRIRFRALTEHVRETHIVEHGLDPRRIEVIPRGIVVQSADPVPTREELGLPREGALVVNVARHAPQKNQVALIKAFAALLPRNPRAHLVLVGKPGESTPDIERAITELSLERQVTLTGHRDPVRPYLRHADAFVFPSKMEGLGTSVLEAMVEGAPVVASDIPPIAEVTDGGRRARLVAPDDISGLADAIEHALASGRQSASDTTAWARELFDIQTVAARVQELLASAASEGVP